MDKTLVIAPWIGEFAFEVFHWQGYMRKKAKDYDKVIVYGLLKNKYLYEDFCDEYIDFPHSREDAVCHFSLALNSKEYLEIISKYSEHESYDLIIPHKEWTNSYWLKHTKKYVQGDQEFKMLGTYDQKLEYDIIFHMRNRSHGSARNWSENNWNMLVKLLDNKYKLACVGSDNDLCIPGVDDFRRFNLKEEANLLRSSKVIVGTLSGGVQYGMLCGIHVIAWFFPNHRTALQERMNPFDNSSTYLDLVTPSPEQIYDKIIDTLK